MIINIILLCIGILIGSYTAAKSAGKSNLKWLAGTILAMGIVLAIVTFLTEGKHYTSAMISGAVISAFVSRFRKESKENNH